MRHSYFDSHAFIRALRPPGVSRAMAFVLAVAVPLATAAIQRVILREPTIAPFVMLFLAATAISWLGGIIPGLVAVTVSALAGNYLLIAPQEHFNLAGSSLQATFLFAVSAGPIAVLAGSLRQAMTRAEERAEVLQRYQMLVQHTREIVLFLAADDGRIVEGNDAAVAAYGFSRQELLSRTIRDLRAPDAPDVISTQLDEASERGTSLETIHRRKDGSTFHVEVSARSATIDQTPTVICVVRDVTERKRAARAVVESEQRVRAKLESILSPEGDIRSLELADLLDAPAMQSLMDTFYELTHIPVSFIDLQGRVLVSVGRQEVCGRFHRIDPRSCAHCVESDTQLTTGIASGAFRLYHCKNNMWDAATPVLVGDRQVGNVFTGQFLFEDEELDRGLFRDQARRYGFPEAEYLAAIDRVPRLSRSQVEAGIEYLVKLAQLLSKLGYANVKLARALRERELLTDSLRESDKQKNAFLALLSHELRNPLTPVRNSIWLLQRTAPAGAQAQRALAVIDRQTAHLAKLVDDLLDMTRISHGKIRLQKSRVEVNELLSRTAQDLASVFSGAEVHLDVRLAEQPLWVDGDATRILQVIGNLLRNAAKFTGAGGGASLSASQDASRGQAVVRVCDTGAGIAPDVLARLFQPFVQADRTLDRAQGGLGLGLAVAKSLVELHGGTLSVRSAGPGKGAEFEVRLPLASAGVSRLAAAPPASKAGKRVLIIEDVADAADSLGEALALHRHLVEISRDGQEGLEKARAFRPDVILCDIGLPGMDGYDVARAIRADPELRGVFLVALTGYASPEDQRAATQAGFDLHMAKPPQLDAIQRLLERAASRDARVETTH